MMKKFMKFFFFRFYGFLNWYVYDINKFEFESLNTRGTIRQII